MAFCLTGSKDNRIKFFFPQTDWAFNLTLTHTDGTEDARGGTFGAESWALQAGWTPAHYPPKKTGFAATDLDGAAPTTAKIELRTGFGSSLVLVDKTVAGVHLHLGKYHCDVTTTGKGIPPG